MFVLDFFLSVAQHAPEGMVTQLQALNTSPQPLGRPPIVGELLCGLYFSEELSYKLCV